MRATSAIISRALSTATAGAAAAAPRAAPAAAAAAPAVAAAAPPPAPPAPSVAASLVRPAPFNSSPSFDRLNLENTDDVDLAELRRVRVLSSTEGELAGRRAIIYKQTRPANSSGTAKSHAWCIRMPNPNGKWTNGLMGWLSSTETLAQPCGILRFDTPEQAAAFCERSGWDFEIEALPVEQAPIAMDPSTTTTRGTAGNQYAYTIFPLAVQGAIKKAGPRLARHIYAHPSRPSATGSSTWANLRHTGYGPDPWRERKDISQTETAWTGPAWPAPTPLKPLPE